MKLSLTEIIPKSSHMDPPTIDLQVGLMDTVFNLISKLVCGI